MLVSGVTGALLSRVVLVVFKKKVTPSVFWLLVAVNLCQGSGWGDHILN